MTGLSNIFSFFPSSPRDTPGCRISYRMSAPVLSTHSYPSTPRPITPIIPHDRLEEDPTRGRTQTLHKIPEVSDQYWTVPFRDGLPTPPSDMNGVAYNRIPSTYGVKLDGISLPPYGKVPTYSRTNSELLAGMVQQTKSQSQPSIKEAPTFEPNNQKKAKDSSASYLQIPSSINNSKGSLAEFAAQMTCLFWFESTTKLKAIEDRSNSAASIVPEAIPTVGFQKWVTNILSTTQVSQNVILLALLFVYRLKKSNPGVRGKKGSEYRLMTIALMLGNKFLDDNTYTNKTWAEVSGISVQEIHIMEVEFLSNVRYNLYASKSEWAKWHVKLSLFAEFFNKAPLAMDNHESTPIPPVLRVSPTLGPSTRTHLPSPPTPESLRAPNWNVQLNGSSHTGVPRFPHDASLPGTRKRALDEPVDEHPTKKIAIPNTIPISVSTLPPTSSGLTSIPALPPMLAPTSVVPQQTATGVVSRLPRPNLTPSSQVLAPGIPAPQFPVAAGRSVPPTYNPASWVPQIQTPAAVPISNGLFNATISLPDPGRANHNPYGVSSTNVSPAVSAYSTNTPQTHLSPSFFLANRNSPYRPVRSVNTLLIPPPSASLQQQRSVPFDHMHYQPLGKTAAERKTGLLPYLHHEAWPHSTFMHPSFHISPNFSS